MKRKAFTLSCGQKELWKAAEEERSGDQNKVWVFLWLSPLIQSEETNFISMASSATTLTDRLGL